GWDVVTLKYGKRLRAAFERPGGGALRAWIDDCPNSLYSALVFQGGAAWRRQLRADIGDASGVRALLDEHDDDSLAALMTNLAGQDMESVLEAFHGAEGEAPVCFIAYTIKGLGLPFAGHKDNHAGLMNPEQMAAFKASNRIPDGAEWEPLAGLDLPAAELRGFLDQVPFAARGRRRRVAARVPVPAEFPAPRAETMSTQEGFGRIVAELGRGDDLLAERIVTTSPDVTVSTNLGGWVNRRGVFDRHPREDVFRAQKVVSAQRWAKAPTGQHIELGIAENNLFILLAALGLSHSLFGERLLPVGALYDPFIQRGLDALNYACYQDARFLLVGTPAGITLGPEGGAHQSISTPLIGIAQDGLASFEPAFVNELAAIMAWAFDYMQRPDGVAEDGAARAAAVSAPNWLRDESGGSVYLRLSTRPLAQPDRHLAPATAAAIIDGGYWLRPPAPGVDLAIAYTGAVAPEAIAAHDAILEDVPGAGLLAVTSADRLNAGWHAAERARQGGQAGAAAHIERLLAPLARAAALVTVIDGHPGALSWLGGVAGHRVQALGVEHFGQSGDLPDLYARYRIDTGAILDACAAACLAGARR
ncbi:MAG: transketolase, partial [Kiloniellaceae bacterium]